MKIYEQSKDPSHKSRNNCGYCRQPGHNRTECPEVAKDWAYFQDFQIPPNRGAHSWYRSRSNPKYWGEWYQDCKNTYAKQLDAKAKAKVTKRSASKCGFCGSPNHNRRNCDLMKSFLEDCYKANENWRREAYKTIVGKLGLDVGAAVNLRKRESYWSSADEYETYIGLITSINWDKLNIMTAFSGSWDDEDKYCQNLEIKALINGEDRWVSIKDCVKKHQLQNLVTERNASHRRYYEEFQFDSVIGKSEQPLSEEWVTSYRDAFDFLVKKRSFERLQKDGIVALINKWK